MATEKTLTRNTEKYCRLAILTAKGCTEILRALVLHQMKLSTPAGLVWTLDNFLNSAFTQENKRKLSDKQYRILFPPGGGLTYIKQWDLSLLAIILLDVCQNVDCVVKMDVKKMKEIRNKVCHSGDAFTEDAAFATYFDQLKICIKRCLVFLGRDDLKTEMDALVQDVEHSSISADESIRILKEWFDSDKRIEEQLVRMDQDLQTIKSTTVNTNEDVHEILSMVKELIQRHPNPASIALPGTPVDVNVKNCAAEGESKVSHLLVDLINAKAKKDPKLKAYVSDPEFEKVLDAVNELKENISSGNREITDVHAKCVVICIHCPNFDSFSDLVYQSFSGHINELFKPVEKAIRRMEGYEEVSLEAAIPEEALWKNMHTLVENILAAYGYNQDDPETQSMDTNRPKSGDPVDVIQGAEILPPDGTQAGTRIRINVQPRSMEHRAQIVDTFTSGSLRNTLEKLALSLREYYHLKDLSIEAKLADRTLPKTEQDIQDALIASYKSGALAVSMSPIVQVNVDEIYTELIIKNDLGDALKGKADGTPPISSDMGCETGRKSGTCETYKDVLFDNQTACKNIYVVGKAGMGKTNWCKKLVATWVKAKQNIGKQWVPGANESFLREYDLVFYLDLQNASADRDIIQMIEHQLFPDRPDLLGTVRTLLANPDTSSRCIIILDGLDEWSVPREDVFLHGIPNSDPTWQCPIITTTRFCQHNELQLESNKPHKTVEIQGLKEDGTNTLIDNIVSRLNTHTGQNKITSDFKSHISKYVETVMEVPLLLTMFVCLWYDGVQLDTHLAGAYSDMMEMLIRFTEEDNKKRLFQSMPTEKLEDMTKKWNTEFHLIPDCLSNKQLLVTYLPFLSRLGKLAFDMLFSKRKEPTWLFDYHTIKTILSEDELELSVKMGIVSLSTNSGSVLKQEFQLSFLHKTLQEYLAALYMLYGNNKSECLTTFRTYCKDAHDVHEMENVLLFISGLCPDTAGEISCYISEMDPDERIHQILLRCWKETQILPCTRTPIYIKHHWLYNDEKHWVYNEETLCYLRQLKDRETSLYVKNGDGLFHETEVHGERLLDLTGCQSLKALHYAKLSVQILVPDSLNEVYIDGYKGSTEWSLDLSACDSLQKLRYYNSDVRMLVPNSLEEVDIEWYRGYTQLVLDLSRCQSLRKLRYCNSDARLVLSNCLKEMDIQGYIGTANWLLDLSGCQSLKKLRYSHSSVPILLSNRLEDVELQGYAGPSAVDLSGCQSLKRLSYKHCNERILVPNCLEEMDIDTYTGTAEWMMDLSGCQSLKKLRCYNSHAQILVPNSLEEVDLNSCRGSGQWILDLSRCRSLRNLRYHNSNAQLLVPNSLENVDIELYKGYTEWVLDLSGCKLTKLRYHRSSVRILVSCMLKEIDIYAYTGYAGWVLDLSGCQSLRTLQYNASSVQILVPNTLEELDMQNFTGSAGWVLDLSKCQLLKKLTYKNSPVRIDLVVTKRLEEVDIECYSGPTEWLLDLSGCQSLKKLQYKRSNVQILVPNTLEEVDIQSYAGSAEWLLDLSGCQSLRTLHYKDTHVQLLVPNALEEVDIEAYAGHAEWLLDFSGCQSLRKLTYHNSCAWILVSKSLEKLDIREYKGSNDKVLDLTRCQSLKQLIYMRSSVQLLVPNNLEEVNIDTYTGPPQWVLDLSECHSLRKLRYHNSSVEILLSNHLEEIDISAWRGSTEQVLDLTGCQSLRTFTYQDEYDYFHKRAPERLQTLKSNRLMGVTSGDIEYCSPRIRLSNNLNLEELDITGYTTPTESVLDLTGCQSLRKLRYHSTKARILVPNSLEEVDIYAYTCPPEWVLDLSGCQSLKKLKYRWSNVQIQVPNSLKEIDIHAYRGTPEWVLDLSGCQSLRKLKYHFSNVQIQVPNSLKEIDIYAYTGHPEWVLDLSGCQSLKELRLYNSDVHILVPNSLEKVDICAYKGSSEWTLDLSGCRLSKLKYKDSNVLILVPNSLEIVDICGYREPTGGLLDLSRCESLRTLKYKDSSVRILVPDGWARTFVGHWKCRF